MNLKKLKAAEKLFLSKYKGGFEDPSFQEIAKKHNMDKLVKFAQESFSKKAFDDVDSVAENLTKMVSRSTMVSLFEKPKFRDFIKDLPEEQKIEFINGFKNFLHGAQKKGFEQILKILESVKLAKWSLITVVPAYFKPKDEVFIKPTTAKDVIRVFELKNLEYKPRPSWEFYQEYRRQITEMKAKVHESLKPSNAAFSGFLMMTMPDLD